LIDKLKNAPALAALLPFMAGLVAGKFLTASWLYAVLLAGLVLSAVCAFYFKRTKLTVFFTLSALLVLAIIRYHHLDYKPAGNISYFCDTPEQTTIEGVVTSPLLRYDNRVTMTVRVDTVWAYYTPFAAQGQVIVSIYDTTAALRYGDRIVARGMLRLPPGQRNPGEMNYRYYLASRNIDAMFSIPDLNQAVILNSGEGNWFLRTLVYPLREFIIRFIEQHIQGQEAALLEGLLVGAREGIDDETTQAFANVGVIHVIAISGMHVVYIWAALMYLFRLTRIPNYLQTLAVIAGLYYYAALAGFNAPVVRAVIMAVVYLLGVLLHRRSDAINTLSLAALLILLFHPLELFQVSFQFSFAAVLGIVLFYQKLYKQFLHVFTRWYENRNRFKIFITQLFFASLAAQLATVPLTAWYYGRVSVIALLLNLPVIPVSGWIVGLGFAAVLCAALWTWPGALILNSTALLLKGLIWIVKLSDKLPLSSFVVPRPSGWLIGFYFCLLFLYIGWEHLRLRKALVITALLLLNIMLARQIIAGEKGLKVTFFDVKQADAALFEFPDGKTMLVDAGERLDQYDYDCGKRVIAPYLQRNNIKKLDVLLLTHPHSDHIGGASWLMQHIKIGRLVTSALPDTSALTREIDSLAAALRIPRRFIARGDTLAGFVNTTICAFHPAPAFISADDVDLNDASVVVKLIYGDVAFMLPGDAGHNAEQAMLNYGDLLRAQVLKAGHHGSSTASSPAFRELVDADYAVVSVGTFNRFGLPSPGLMLDFAREGSQVVRTDANGAVVFWTDGVRLQRVR